MTNEMNSTSRELDGDSFKKSETRLGIFVSYFSRAYPPPPHTPSFRNECAVQRGNNVYTPVVVTTVRAK